MISCCNTNSKIPVVGQAVERCKVHLTQLKTKDGFTFNDNILADPSWDYVRFMDEERFQHTTPWYFSPYRTDNSTKPKTVDYCPICDEDFAKGYADFQRLTEEEKEAVFLESIRKEAQKKKQNKPLRQPEACP